MWSSFIVPPVVMRAVTLFVWSAPPPNLHSLPGLPPLSGSEPQRRVGKQNKQAKAQQNSVLLGEERGESLTGRGDTGDPPNSYGVLGTPKSSEGTLGTNSREVLSGIPATNSSYWRWRCAPNLEVSPKPRVNQITGRGRGLSLLRGFPNSRGTEELKGIATISQGGRWGILRQYQDRDGTLNGWWAGLHGMAD